MKLAFAETAATQLLELLRPCCTWAAVAGSVRRQCPDVGDVELVLVPSFVANPYKGDLFGGPHVAQLDLLIEKLTALRAAQQLVPRPSKTGQIAWGTRAIRAVYQWTAPRTGTRTPPTLHAPVDLFIVRPPAQLGLIYFIRTGDADYSARGLARWKEVSGGGWSEGGCLRDRDGKAVPTPTEEDVFRALRWTFVPPLLRGQRTTAATDLELPDAPPPPAATTDCPHDWTGALADAGDGAYRPTCLHCGRIRPPSDLT
jgi:DNA polymerase/3'-5' exonuclease PolX